MAPGDSCPLETQARRVGTGRSRQCTGRPGHDDDDEEDPDGQDDELEGNCDFSWNFSYIAIVFDAVFPEVSH